jgi:hypothetical protein
MKQLGAALLGVALLASSLMLLGGCGSQTQSSTPPSIEQQIEDVKKNPKMPPQAKEQVLKMLQQRQTQTTVQQSR